MKADKLPEAVAPTAVAAREREDTPAQKAIAKHKKKTLLERLKGPI